MTNALVHRRTNSSAQASVSAVSVNDAKLKFFVLSDATPDRYGDVIEAAGWDLKNFKNNPVALFNHNPDFPVGKWVDLKILDGKLTGALKLAERGTSARIDEIISLVDADILQAV